MEINKAGPQPTDAAGVSSRRRARIESPEQFLLILTLVVLTAAISWGVLSRYVVTAPAAWVEEISSIAFAWLIFIGAAEVQRRRQHISVDILTALLPPSVQRVLSIMMEFIVIGFCLYAAYLGAAQALASRGSSTSILHLPLWIGYLGFTIGFLLMAMRSIQFLYAMARMRMR